MVQQLTPNTRMLVVNDTMLFTLARVSRITRSTLVFKMRKPKGFPGTVCPPPLKVERPEACGN